MKKLLFLFFILSLFSCIKEKGPTISKNENPVVENYNFSQFEPILNRQNDTIYVINFWATWCAPCVKELPYFEDIQNTYSKQKVKVILVSLDFPEKIKSQLIPFIKEKNITSQVIILDDSNENKWIPKIDESWSGAIPATLIYSKNKRAFYEQSFTKELLFKEIEKFI